MKPDKNACARHPFWKHSIRFKLLYGYLLAFVLAICIGNALLYLFIRDTIEVDIERELSNTTESILNMVKTTTDVAIKNHLRAVAEKNREIVDHFYQLQLRGELSREQAQSKAAELLLSQVIGTTGYIYCINSRGIIQVHPKQRPQSDLSTHPFIRRQMQQREGYVEYVWANPGETNARPKALYMTYFGPWDWIISASSYRDEFKELFNIEDFRQSILSITFGKTGYPYVIDSKGNLIIHPRLEGTNIYDSTDSSGRKFIQELCARKNGKIIYPWQNPGEPEPREKLVIFNYIEELDWIVASSSYLEEFYEPLKTIGYTSAAMMALSLVLMLPMTWWLSTSLTRPIRELISGFSHGAKGDYSNRINVADESEIGQLAAYYNHFMDQLQASRKELEQSEQKYRGIFENAVEGVFQTALDGRFISANPSMARMLGYADEIALLKQVNDIQQQIYATPDDRDRLIHLLEDEGMVQSFETRFRRADGHVIWVSINARIARTPAGRSEYVEGLASDITQRKDSEKALRQAKEKLEQRVEERTTELSNWIKELERMNTQRSLLQDMGQMIQLCRSIEETSPVILKYLHNFFPDDVATLYILNESSSLLESINPQDEGHAFDVDDCWAIRQGKPYLVDENHSQPPCGHMQGDTSPGYACNPLIAQGELIGLLLVRFSMADAPQNESKQRLANRVAENLALTLANLKLRDTLRLQSIQDPLTGLYNRRFMDEIIATQISRTIRRGRAFGILMIDIDHFKAVNDTHGHDVGDMVLRALGSYLSANVRAEDIPCRYGGEEFAVIMNEVGLDALGAKADEIRATIASELSVPVNGKTLSITVSVGAALFPKHGETAEEVIKAADEALYKAKEGGRNRAVIAG